MLSGLLMLKNESFLIVVVALFLAIPVDAQMRIFRYPATARACFDWIFRLDGPTLDNSSIRLCSKSQTELYDRELSIAGYYILQCLDSERYEHEQFEKAFSVWCDGYFARTHVRFDVLTTKDHKALKCSLLKTKTGQQYIRFPRIKFTADGEIVKRYPFPELYGAKFANIVIHKNDPLFSTYTSLLESDKCKSGEEAVLVDFENNSFDWTRSENNLKRPHRSL